MNGLREPTNSRPRTGSILDACALSIRNAHIWLPGYLSTSWQQRDSGPVKHVLLLIADHFEPLWKGPDERTAAQRVQIWRDRWPQIASRYIDSDGRPPCYTFFYPQEEYRPAFLDSLAEMTQRGIADVEVHIHHDGEGQQNFVDRMEDFKTALAGRHGLLRRWHGKTAFGFIHGNWALDNARRDGRWCGLNNELELLRDLGCYADFTLPSVPFETQSRLVNTIFWANDDPLRAKSYDTGVPVKLGEGTDGDLLMIPGPLGLNWSERRQRLFPKVDTGELAHNASPSLARVRLWLRHAPRLGEFLFLKLFAHGAQERNADSLLNGGLDKLFSLLDEECRRQSLSLHFVSAWQMRCAVESYRRGEEVLTSNGSTASAARTLDRIGSVQ